MSFLMILKSLEINLQPAESLYVKLKPAATAQRAEIGESA